MTKLILGVIDVPYQKLVAPSQRRVSVKRKKGGAAVVKSSAPSGAMTTGDVAEILEDKYHVMEVFFELHQPQIVKTLECVIGNAFADALGGAPLRRNAPVEAASRIQNMFTKFIDSKGMDGLQPGVPTKASLAGINHRLKHPYASKNPIRPSFKDTGLYEQSMRVEIK